MFDLNNTWFQQPLPVCKGEVPVNEGEVPGGEGSHSSSLPDSKREDHIQVSGDQEPSDKSEQQSNMMDFINLTENGLHRSPRLQALEQEKRKAEAVGKG